jgi:hypothetical protein
MSSVESRGQARKEDVAPVRGANEDSARDNKAKGAHAFAPQVILGAVVGATVASVLFLALGSGKTTTQTIVVPGGGVQRQWTDLTYKYPMFIPQPSRYVYEQRR